MELEFNSNFEIEDLGAQEDYVFDIEVQDNHNFFANNILVHNSNYLNCGPIVDILLKKLGKTEESVSKEFIVNLLDKFFKVNVEPYLEESYVELYWYMNNIEQLMHMDREVIADAGFWTAKKKYALNVWDSEGKRKYDEHGHIKPSLKIIGLETRKSSTPKFVADKLETSISIILRKDERTLQEFYKSIFVDFCKQPIEEIAQGQTVNGFDKYIAPNLTPLPKAGLGIKAVIAYKKAKLINKDLPELFDGDKIRIIRLKTPNIFNSDSFGWPAGENLPIIDGVNFRDIIDYKTMFDKTFTSPIETMCKSISWEYKKINKLSNLLGI